MQLDVTACVLVVVLVIGLTETARYLAPVDAPAAAACSIGYVYDGDSAELRCGQNVETARFLGFDTPESKNPRCSEEKRAATAATRRMRELIAAGPYVLSQNGRDKYRRPLVEISRNGQNLGDILINENLAVPYAGGKRPDWCARLRAQQ